MQNSRDILTARRVYFEYSILGLPVIQDYLRHLIELIDQELESPS